MTRYLIIINRSSFFSGFCSQVIDRVGFQVESMIREMDNDPFLKISLIDGLCWKHLYLTKLNSIDHMDILLSGA